MKDTPLIQAMRAAVAERINAVAVAKAALRNEVLREYAVQHDITWGKTIVEYANKEYVVVDLYGESCHGLRGMKLKKDGTPSAQSCYIGTSWKHTGKAIA